jgi:hypothetical protein
MGTGPIFVRKRTPSTCGQNNRKWGLSPFFKMGLHPLPIVIKMEML